MTLEVDADTGELIADWVSLNGTDTNCAGIPTPWGTWLTCEETTIGVKAGLQEAARLRVRGRPGEQRAPSGPSPYKKLGRFLHEAGAVDPETGVVYMTEDEGPDGFYRFVPDEPGDLRKGVLQMLRVKGKPTLQHHHRPDRGRGARQRLGHHRRPGPEQRRGRRVGGLQAGPGQGRREVPRRRGLHACATTRSSSAPATAATPGCGQVWQYTPRTNIGKLNERGDLVLLFESREQGPARRPRQHVHQPGRRDRHRRGRQPDEQLRPGAAARTAR